MRPRRTQQIADAIATMPCARESDHDGLAIREKRSQWFRELAKSDRDVLASANREKRSRWIARKSDRDQPRAQESDREAPPRIATAIAIQLANLQESKCETSRYLARARTWSSRTRESERDKLAGSRKRPRCIPRTREKAIAMKPPVAKRNCDDTGQPHWRQPVKKSRALNKTRQSTICWPLLPWGDKKVSVLTWVVKNSVYFFKPYSLLWDTTQQNYMQYLADNCQGTCCSDQTQRLIIIFCFSILKAWLPWGTQQHSWILACWFIFYSHEVCSKPNLTTNPITTFATMLVPCIGQWLPSKDKLNIWFCWKNK